MPALRCIICEDTAPITMLSAIGERAYCPVCHHGWRTSAPDYAYAVTAMCPLGTSPERLHGQIRFFEPFVQARPEILEIGCATGELARATQSFMPVARYDAIEISPAAEAAKSRVDRLHTRPLPELIAAGQIEGFFDLVSMSHVIEHLEDPEAELLAIARVLKPEGVVFLEAPNRSGNRSLPIDDNASHLHFFSATSLTRLLAKTGFETLAVTTDAWLDSRYADSLRIIGRRFRPPTWSPTLLSERIPPDGSERIVVWGAGSLAAELLANYFDLNQIDFFIDRNAEKIGSTCLGRPIRGPGDLGDDPRTVLINSIDFADSIVADIDRLYPGAGHRLVRIGDLLR